MNAGEHADTVDILEFGHQMVWMDIPESLPEDKREELANRTRDEFTLRNIQAALTRPRVGPLFNIRFVSGLAFSMLTTIFPLYDFIRFGLEPAQPAYILMGGLSPYAWYHLLANPDPPLTEEGIDSRSVAIVPER